MTLSIRSRSLDMRSVSPHMARRSGPSRPECGAGGLSEQMDPRSPSMCTLRRRVEVRTCGLAVLSRVPPSEIPGLLAPP